MTSKNDSIEKKKCVTHEFRVSYPNVFKPTSFDDQEAKFGLTMLFSKDIDLSAPAAKQKNSLKRIVANALKEKFGPDKTKWPSNFKNPIRDGDKEKPDDPTYENMLFARATAKVRPQLVGPRLTPITNEDDFYPGCYARAEVIAYWFEKAGNKGVGLSVTSIQKTRDGEPLGGRRNAAEIFDVIGDADEDDDDVDEEDDDDDFDFG